MKHIISCLIFLVSSNYTFGFTFLSSPVQFECHPVEYSNGVNRDFKLSLRKPSFLRSGEVIWTRIDDNFVREYPYVSPKKPTLTLSDIIDSVLVKGKNFVKTKDNSSLIIIRSKNELYIEKSLFKGEDRGLVYQYEEDGNLLDTTRVTSTIFDCVRE